MAITPEGDQRFTAEVVEAKGHCGAGHKQGDKFELSCYDCGGLCGFFYHDIFPGLSVMAFGGQYPWNPPDEATFLCPDPVNQVTLKVTAIK